MKRQLSITIYGLKFAMEKNDFERISHLAEKRRNDFVANPIPISPHLVLFNLYEWFANSLIYTTLWRSRQVMNTHWLLMAGEFELLISNPQFKFTH